MITKLYQNQRILITGGSGFIGRHLREKLYGLGAKVFSISRHSKLEGENELDIRCDLSNFSQLQRTIDQISPEIIFHLAANIDRDLEFDTICKMVENNLLGTINLFKCSRKQKYLKKIIVAGTSEEYGPNPVPFHEQLHENPVSPYSFSKVCITHLTALVDRLYDLPTLILRPTVAYGPGQDNNMFIPTLIQALLDDEKFEMTEGEQTRDFIFVDDLVDAYIKAGISKIRHGTIINIGSGEVSKIRDVAILTASQLHKEHLLEIGSKEYRRSEMMSYSSNITRAKKMLNWTPMTTLEDGLKITIESYRV